MLPMKNLKRYVHGFLILAAVFLHHGTGGCDFASNSDFQEAFHLGAKIPVLKFSPGNGCML